MAVGDKQKIITKIVSIVLDEPAQCDVTFNWFINKHMEVHFEKNFPIIDNVFSELHGDIEKNQNKRTQNLKCDAYFGGITISYLNLMNFNTLVLQDLRH